jgi:putative transposase
MKLTLQIKLLPNKEQGIDLLKTIKKANAVCSYLSNMAFDKKIFRAYDIHHLCYSTVKDKFFLSAQVIVRCIGKVADAYKTGGKEKKRTFRPLGSIAYDSRILSYTQTGISIWSVGGRLKMPFTCHNPNLIPFIKGEGDLLYRKGKFFLFQTIDIPDPKTGEVEEFIGCDFGIVDICTTSDGNAFSSEKINAYREKRQKIRSSLQHKGTKGSKRVLKRLSKRERRTSTIINHTIAKNIVQIAKGQNKGISLEDLTGIRQRAGNKGKKFKSRLGKWSFAQLRSFIEYKAAVAGVKVVRVNSAYTSQGCHICKHMGRRTGKSFVCDHCGNNMDADHNAAINIATLGACVNSPEKSDMYSCAVHYQGLKFGCYLAA